ncbi:acyl carrier protein [Haliangium sp.]|uniref:acyl carrier protein n=1 Tax=Haliangium sp. TaxID=2663208 RepID=UPI003D13D3E8
MSAQQNLEATFGTIREVIAKVAKVPTEQVVLDSPVSGLDNVDSIVLLEIIARVETLLDIDIDEEALFEIGTVGDFVTLCHQQVSAR